MKAFLLNALRAQLETLGEGVPLRARMLIPSRKDASLLVRCASEDFLAEDGDKNIVCLTVENGRFQAVPQLLIYGVPIF